MALQAPHLKWPFTLAANSTRLVFVEQDSAAEVEQCVGFVLTTVPGSCVPTPALGMPDPTFSEGGVTEAELAAAIQQWEPRASFTFTQDELVGRAQLVGIRVST